LIFFVDRFKLTDFVGVIPPAGRALVVEVSSNVIPAKSANLVFALARFEVEVGDVHLFEAQWAFLRLLLIAPICILYAGQDRRLCMQMCARTEYGCWKGRMKFERRHCMGR
jgi:hypothetical protein